MATVTKPMALDESFNTTENTSRNVADVLAEGLDNIAESILPKAATEIPIESGSATDTKSYIDSKFNGLVSKKSYTVSLALNSFVQPFTHFARFTIPSSDISTYGTPISTCGKTDTVTYIEYNTTNNIIVKGMQASDTNFDVIFLKT